MAVGSMPEEKRPANCVGCRSCEWVCLQRINGQLLDAAKSPFHRAMMTAQCIQYALDRPGVLTVLPGPGSVAELAEILHYFDTPAEERDYALISALVPDTSRGSCVQCGHCNSRCPPSTSIKWRGCGRFRHISENRNSISL